MSDDRNLGPDERDRDLLDGSWEQKYYSGTLRSRDWRSIGIGLSLLVLIAITVPMLLMVLR